jgi:hypothetical protein
MNSPKLYFVCGKGGVGKTTVSHNLAQVFAEQGNQVLWTTFEDPLLPKHQLELKNEFPSGGALYTLNCFAGPSFEEYAGILLKIPALTKIFLRNTMIQYLATAAPGMHEITLLGKVWYERSHYDQVVVDMPSTGHGMAMFQSVKNFSQLFKGGPIHRDAEAMLGTFQNPSITRFIIVSLLEEMPLQESIELGKYLHAIFPDNPPQFGINRRFPSLKKSIPDPALLSSAESFVFKRNTLEKLNLEIWEKAGIPVSWEIPAVQAAQVNSTAQSVLRSLLRSLMSSVKGKS